MQSEATLILPPNASAGITFSWTDEKLIATSFVNPDGIRAKKAGITVGMNLSSINGKSVEGWTFADIIATMKQHAAAKRILRFTTPMLENPSPPKNGAEEFPPPADQTSSHTTVPATAHNDPLSTPSRRRRVYLQAAKTFYNNYKREGIKRAVKHIIELEAIRKIIPAVRTFLAKRYWQGVIKKKRDRAVVMLQNAARSRAASMLLSKLKKGSMSNKERMAAIFIQSTVRSSLAAKEAEMRRKLKVMQQMQLNSATLLQRSTRNMLARKENNRKLEEAKKMRCIVFIQCRIRKFLARCRYNMLKKESVSSWIIQKAWKRELARRDDRHNLKMKAIYKLQQVLRRRWVAFGVIKHAAMLKQQQQQQELVCGDDDDESVLSLQSSVLNQSGMNDMSVSRMELTIDDEFSLMSPEAQSLKSASLVPMSPELDDSIIEDPILPDKDLMEKYAARKIQRQARSYLRLKYSHAAAIIIMLLKKHRNAKRAIYLKELRKNSNVVLQCFVRKTFARRKVESLRELRVMTLRDLMEVQFSSCFSNPTLRRHHSIISDIDDVSGDEGEGNNNNFAGTPYQTSSNGYDTAHDTIGNDDLFGEGDSSFWASLNRSMKPEISCLLRKDRKVHFQPWDIPLTPIGPWLPHWKSDMFDASSLDA